MEYTFAVWFDETTYCQIECDFAFASKSEYMQARADMEPIAKAHKLENIVLSRSHPWCSKTQKRLKTWQYQTFTNKNPTGAPPKPTIKEALEAAMAMTPATT